MQLVHTCLTPEEAATHPFKVGMRVSYTIPERGGFRLGFGDIEKVNRKTIIVIDAKHPDKARYMVDRALIYRCMCFNKEESI